ncbi:hypothetical protein [Pleurocapsa sp. CCALA 161]|nr:hypothetical protein [Pleurocapsa sp. CCALA 161]
MDSVNDCEASQNHRMIHARGLMTKEVIASITGRTHVLKALSIVNI